VKPLFQISARPLGRTGGRVELLREWPNRLQHVLPMLPYLSAEYVQKYIRAQLPKGSDFHAYRRGLEIAKVKGLSPGQFAYALHIDLKNRLIRKVRPNSVLLYVHVRKKGAEARDKPILVLEKHNPWTMNSLPFSPDPRFAFITKKRVHPMVVQATTDRRLKERPVWVRELSRAGHRYKFTRKDRWRFPKKARVLPSIALEALTLEFGLGGAKAKPLWRVGIRRLIKAGLRSFIKNPKYFVFPLTKPSYKLWKKWPIRTRHSIAATKAARDYVPFQKKLGIRP